MDGMDVDSEDGRRRIRDRFFTDFQVIRDEEVASRVDSNARTVKRWRSRERVPHPKQAAILLQMIEKGMLALLIDPQELADRGEEARRQREARQSLIPHTELNAPMPAIPIPTYYARARRLIEQRRWPEAAAALEYWGDGSSGGGLSQVPADTKPYLLNSFALSLYYLARYDEARELWEQALNIANRRTSPKFFLLSLDMMIGNAYWRRGRYQEAFARYDAIALHAPEFFYVYYNALCAADASTDGYRLSTWIGRIQGAAKFHFPPSAIQEMLRRATDDLDLRWAREQPQWRELIDWLHEMLRSMTNRSPN
ncbi:hypothetical protein STVA_10490 [Allostella vacuolata]|nr:hypothetical protein STVA_10490 [Stella vacuolata]